MATSSHANCSDWAARLSAIAVAAPVQRATRDAIDHWRGEPERVDANLLADIVLADPLMCLRLLVNVARKVGHRLATPIQTVTAALVLIGIEPFFRDFTALPVLEEQLAEQPYALAGALAAVQRSLSAARLAAAFAIHCGDEDVELLREAALLHNFAFLLLWCEAPAAALEMSALQRNDPTLRSTEVQREVLGFELEELAHEMIRSWGMPTSLREAGLAARRGPRIVSLAVRLARHLQSGWHNAALADDFTELGQLLNLPPHSAAALVRQITD
jgi:HD-like signal output (HDOD) protein